MKARNLLAALLLMSTQTVLAQKMKVTTTDNQVVEFDISNVKDVTFEDAEPEDDHAWVDLGLPSGTLWATCNVGANSPEEFGDYFAWGETQPKEVYDWSTYIWMKEGGQPTRTRINKYTCEDGQTNACWYSGGKFVGDGRTELLPEDDAATANWGSAWQMPSLTQIKELYNKSYTTTVWTTQEGVRGRLITSNSNGNSIFLPATGYHDATSSRDVGVKGYYWSRSLYIDNASSGKRLWFDASRIGATDEYRCNGQTVRPVRATK
jgi:hypothetical protein